MIQDEFTVHLSPSASPWKLGDSGCPPPQRLSHLVDLSHLIGSYLCPLLSRPLPSPPFLPSFPLPSLPLLSFSFPLLLSSLPFCLLLTTNCMLTCWPAILTSSVLVLPLQENTKFLCVMSVAIAFLTFPSLLFPSCSSSRFEFSYVHSSLLIIPFSFFFTWLPSAGCLSSLFYSFWNIPVLFGARQWISVEHLDAILSKVNWEWSWTSWNTLFSNHMHVLPNPLVWAKKGQRLS